MSFCESLIICFGHIPRSELMKHWIFYFVVKLPSWNVDPTHPPQARTRQQTFPRHSFFPIYFWTAPQVSISVCVLYLVVENTGYSLAALCGLFITGFSLAELSSRRGLQWLLQVGSVVSALELSGPAICGIFLDQRLKLHPLRCKILNLCTTREALASFLMTLHYCFFFFQCWSEKKEMST